MIRNRATGVAILAALLAASAVRAAEPAPKTEPAKAEQGSGGETGITATSQAATLNRPAFALFGLYSWGGYGLGARVEWPIAQNTMQSIAKDFQFKNEIVGVGGIDYYTQSYGWFANDYRWNYLRIEAGAMWNFWFTDKFAAYPKLTLGYDAAWLSGWDNAWGPTPSSGGLAFEAAVGVIYDLNKNFQLRGELGNGSIKAGVGFRI